jgi:hypothetical protein
VSPLLIVTVGDTQASRMKIERRITHWGADGGLRGARAALSSKLSAHFATRKTHMPSAFFMFFSIIWQITRTHQLHLHLDYEASHAKKYNKPWGVNLGYRWQF